MIRYGFPNEIDLVFPIECKNKSVSHLTFVAPPEMSENRSHK